MGVFLKTRVLSNSPISVNPALALEFQAGLWVLRRAMVKYRLTNARTFTTQARALLFWQYQIPVPLTSRQGACSTHNRKHRPLGPNASRKAAWDYNAGQLAPRSTLESPWAPGLCYHKNILLFFFPYELHHGSQLEHEPTFGSH